MYFEDLSSYRYDRREPLPNVLNVGWLDSAHEYSRAEVRPELQEKLMELCVHKSVNQMRGFHHCNLCSVGDLVVDYRGRRHRLGSAEAWIPGDGDILYASPNLIVHYVAAHRYLPPAAYLAALEKLSLEDWNPPKEYSYFLRGIPDDIVDVVSAGDLARARSCLASQSVNRDDFGEALSIAVKGGRADLVDLLLDAGADPSIRNTAAKSAEDLAVSDGFAECVALLRAAPARRGGPFR